MAPRKDPQRRRRVTRVLVPIAVLLLGAALSPCAGEATPEKPYGDVVVACAANEPCSGTATDGTTTAVVDADSGGADAVLTIVLLPTDAISCTGYDGTSATVDFNVTADDRTKTVTITIPSELVGERSAIDFEVCYSSPNGFIDKIENTVPPRGTGLLPDCTFSEELPDNPPCVLSRTTNEDGSVSVSFFAPDGDPKGHS